MIDHVRTRLRAWLGVPSAGEPGVLDASASPEPAVVDDNPENPANWLSLDYVHDRVLAQLDAQNQRWESADARLRLVLGLIGVVFAITSSFASRTVAPGGAGLNAVEPFYLPFWVGALLISGLALYSIAGLTAAFAYWPLTFYRPPDPVDLRAEYLTTNLQTTKLETMDTILEAWALNEAALKRKFRAFKIALVLTTIATVLFGTAVIIQLLSITRAWS